MIYNALSEKFNLGSKLGILSLNIDAVIFLFI